MKNFISIFFIFFLISNFTFSQTVGEKYIWEFRDGTIIHGSFVKATNADVIITDDNGEEVYIPKVMIAQRNEANEENYKNGEYFFHNLHDTRYFFSPSAFGLNKGEGYYNNAYYLMWQFQYGISDKVSIGGGSTLWGFPTTINLKYSDNISDNLNYSLGYFYVGDFFNITNIEESDLLSMPYALITKGSKEKNISVGISYNFAKPLNTFDDNINYEQGFRNERVVLNIGAISRLSRRFSFVFEGWFFNQENLNFLGGPGIRYFSKVKRITARNGAGAKTVDFQIFIISDDDSNVALPMIGRSWRF